MSSNNVLILEALNTKIINHDSSICYPGFLSFGSAIIALLFRPTRTVICTELGNTPLIF